MANLTRLEKEILAEHFVDEEEFINAKKRVEGGEPLAYVIGEWYFYGLTFKLNKYCLIPRPDTEHTVEKAIGMIPKNGRFADLCTGSGCIAISIIKNRPDLTGEGYDISEGAITAAKENALLNGTDVKFFVADIMKTKPKEKIYDAVISNPPYVKSDVIPKLETGRYEPTVALDGGKDGMDFYRGILKHYSGALKENGIFIFEIGYDQGKSIKQLAEQNGFFCTVTKDYGGNDRVALLERKN